MNAKTNPASLSLKVKGEQGKVGFFKEEMPALRASIAKHRFFRGLGADCISLLADCAMQTRFRQDVLIFAQGDVANRFYLIESGRVALEVEQQGEDAIRIQTLGPGDILGWSWLFPPYVWRFSARSLEATRAIFFYGTWLREQFEQHPGLGNELMNRTAEVVVGRLQATQMQLVEISQVAMRAQLQALQMAAPTKKI
jgi:CRP-like cAMP-binding protein